MLSLLAPSETYAGQVELFDARGSTGILKMPLPDGSAAFEIKYGDGYTANLLASGHVYQKAGTYTITLADRVTNSSITKSIIVRDVPTGTVQTLVDSGSLTTNKANLQAAINLAASRNIVEQTIVCPAGFKCQGTIYTPKPVGDKWITIRSASLNLLTQGKRVTPADESKMFQILSVNGGVAIQAPAPASGTHHYRFQGMKVGQVDSTIYVQSLVYVGVSGGPFEKETLAHHFIFDRCWFDGGPNDTDQVRSGLEIWGDYVTLMDSRVGENRRVGVGVDSQAIGITVGQGPYSFVNNFLSATSENVNLASGGAGFKGRAVISNSTTTSVDLSHVKNLELDMNLALPIGGSYSAANSTIVRSIVGNRVTFDQVRSVPDAGGTAEWAAVPSYIEFRGNHLPKPLKWWPKHSSWNGVTYQIKNLFETKFSRYMVVDGNVMENSWLADQAYAVAITPRGMNGGESVAAVVRELQFTNNIVRNASSAINIMSNDNNGPIQLTTDLTFRNNIFQNVGNNFDPYGAGKMLINFQSPFSIRAKRIFFINNTDDNGTPSNGYTAITDLGTNGGADESVWMNNLGQDRGYGIRSNNYPDVAGSLAAFLSPGTTNVKGNQIVNNNNRPYPSSSFAVALHDWPSMFVAYPNDLTLRAGVPGKGLNGGKDAGADIAAVKYATRGAVSGVWDGSVEPPPPPPIDPPPPPPPTPVTPSPDGTKATTITDSQGAVWTLSGTHTLRNGVYVGSGQATIYKYLTQVVYAKGVDTNWYKWTTSWEMYGPTEPGVVITPPPPPLPPTCTLDGPDVINVPKNSETSINITVSNVTQPVTVSVVGSSGQVSVSPLSKTAISTSNILAFRVKVKSQSRTITFNSPCGSKSVKVNVQ